MFLVDDIYDESREIVGTCEEPLFFRWLSDSVSLIANKGDFEGWKGYVDICTTGRGQCLTLPREVETVLGVNIGGVPSLGHDQLFNFHLNGMGDCKQSCEFSWQDQGNFWPTYRDIEQPRKLVCYVQKPSDSGKSIIVHGFDNLGNVLRRQVNGVWMNGYQVPTIYGYAVPDAGAPLVARVTAVIKDFTDGSLRLSTVDNSGLNGVLLGVYEPDERYPQYRRIKLARQCNWVRIAYRKINPILRSRFDHIMLRSRLGFLMALRACHFYHEADLANAHAYEADAIRLELEAQMASTPSVLAVPQIIDRNNPQDKSDYDIR
jgi:hypothetical protein